MALGKILEKTSVQLINMKIKCICIYIIERHQY